MEDSSQNKINLKSLAGLTMATVNPCNDFIIRFLISMKLKSDKQGITKFTTYNLAIESVRKYPLPIICEDQLTVLEGFGPFFIEEVAKIIQKHYKRGRMPTLEERKRDDLEILQALRSNSFESKKRTKTEGAEDQEKREQNFSLTQNNQNYQPRLGTEPFRTIHALLTLRNNGIGATKGEINEILFNMGYSKIKSWETTRTRLEQSGYITKDENQLFHATEKSKNYVRIVLLQNNLNIESQSNSNNSMQEIGAFEQIEEIEAFEQVEKIEEILEKKKIEQNSLVLFIDKSLESSFQEQIIERKLREFNFEFAEIELATFVWALNGEDFNYIAIRVKVNQIEIENFQLTCLRAKNCKINYAVVIAQFPEGNPKLSIERGKEKLEKVHETIRQFRVEGLRIVKTRGFEETLNWAAELTQLINKKVKPNPQKNNFEENLKNFNKSLRKPMLLVNIFVKGLKMFPDLSSQVAYRIAKKMGSFKLMQDKLNRVNQKKWKNLIRHLLKDCAISDETIMKIVSFFRAEKFYVK